MKNSTKNILIVIISFGIYFVIDDYFFKETRKWIFELTNQLGLSHILTYALSGIPLFLGTLLVSGKANFLKSLGLNQSILKGFLFALICTLPMFIGFSFVFDFDPKISLNTFLISVVAAGFFEELFFRGFLFGLLFSKTKLGFIPSVFFGAFYFGTLHLYQSTDLAEMWGIFLITFLGGVLFAWVFAEWKFNIWIPIFLHLLMNLSWELFDISNNALGGIYSNVFRLVTISLIIALTVLYKMRKGLKLEINKKNILIKKMN
ncbi:CPBP family intramembrane glutamic endopeptidase [Gelidibacter sp. F63206]|uniref:CPBP family intramembrane glutamic endopeptidase n=1 Tax=Gelidibacter sp. F63206 TaxID=2926425 RepID=UPI001FF4CB01|nr:CPBP family intramembrane glutamic endopeptidase [Gelidibacter sp. F63206]MCK0114913.1 CPBP family intramembrane metalloprotease [Gelidibacter sp. F63206]